LLAVVWCVQENENSKDLERMNPLLRHKLEQAKKRAEREDNSLLNPKRYLWVLHPFYQFYLWIMTVSFGASASLLSDEIMAFALPGGEYALDSVNGYTITHAVWLLVLALSFILNAWMTRLADSITLDSVLTMPPRDYWNYMGESFSKVDSLCEVMLLRLLVEPNAEEFTNKAPDEQQSELAGRINAAKNDVRILLDAIINLAKKWDAVNLRDTNVVYRANIMQVVRVGDDEGCVSVGSDRFDELTELADRFSVKPFESHYTGFVALLSNDYTTTTESENPEPDSKREQIAFPFTDKDNDLVEPIYSNILGAPKAVVDGVESYVSDVVEIVQDYDNKCNIKDTNVFTALHDYYSDRSVAQSILSIPMVQTRDASGEVNRTLNLYRNQTGLLFDGSKVTDFAQLIKPFVSVANRMLDAIELTEETLENGNGEHRNGARNELDG